MKRALKILVWTAVVAYLGAAAYMTAFQRSFLYRVAPTWQAPADHGLPQGERREFTASDGTNLVGWWIAPTRENQPVYLYFHGNADGLAKRAVRFQLLTGEGAGLLAMSYRGYGGSGGAPSEAAIHADALAIHRDLASRIAPERIVVFGESLGTGVALNLARQVKARGVILDSPYFSVVERARSAYPWLPVSRLLTDQFRSDLFIKEVDEPVFIFHGDRDFVVPAQDSEKLTALAKSAQVTRKLYAGKGHVMPLNEGP
ncbi:MAG: alpha/beta hydrolase, partial [Rhabdaerophilum sp.]